MPDMPTFSVTQTQADRIQAAGITPAMAREIYRKTIVAEVLRLEARKLDLARDQQLTEISDSLPQAAP